MRRIPLKIVDSVGPAGDPQKFTYAANIIGLTKMPAGGASVDDMDLVLAIVEAVDAATAHDAREVVLEEQHYNYLCQVIKTARFHWVTKELRQFCRDILEAETFQPNAGDPTASRDPGRVVPRVGPIVPRDDAA